MTDIKLPYLQFSAVASPDTAFHGDGIPDNVDNPSYDCIQFSQIYRILLLPSSNVFAHIKDLHIIESATSVISSNQIWCLGYSKSRQHDIHVQNFMNSTGFDLDYGCLIDLATSGTDDKSMACGRQSFTDRHDLTGAQ